MAPERWRRIKRIAFEAMDLQPEERFAFIAVEAGDDEELRRSVERLVEADAHGSDIFERAIAEEAARLQRSPEPGMQIGHYRLIEKLGAGGMGEVWKAEDTQLRRTAALKFLSSETLKSDDTRARLVREAQASASLDHPNICQVYGIHEDKGETFIAMAYIDGPSLADKIKERPLPLKEALDIAVQIAEGLQEAHEKGIVHRDIKPHNVMLTAKGQVKIMDFGLAAVTGRSRLTKTGTTLGTPAYMAPEQLKGREVDRRADVWGLGCVLYEMLTQRTPFEAEHEQAIAYGILNMELEPLTACRSGIPVQLDRVVGKALAKAPEERYQSASDFSVDLKAQLRLAKTTDKRSAGAGSAKKMRAMLNPRVASAVIAILMLGFGYWLGLQRPRDSPRKVARVTVDLPEGVSLDTGVATRVAISPNGETIAFAGRGSDSVKRLYARAINSFDVRALPGTEDAIYPLFSPDGSRLVFRANGSTKVVSLRGGQAQVLTPRNEAPDAWMADGRILMRTLAGELTLLTPVDGAREVLTQNLIGPKVIRFARLLPEEGAVLYSGRDAPGDGQIWFHEFSTGTSQKLIDGGKDPTYLPTGHLVYAWRGELLAARFSPDRLALEVSPRSVAQGLFASWQGDHAWAVSKNGTLVYAPGEVQSLNTQQIAWVDRDGNIDRPPIDPSRFTSVSISPDGNSFAVGTRVGTPNVWIGNVRRGSIERFTLPEGSDPVWTPDSKSIIFGSRRDGDQPSLYRRRVGSAQEAARLTNSKAYQVPHDVSPDGRWLAFVEFGADNSDLLLLDMDNGNEVRAYRAGPENEIHPVFSPDGKWIAYASDRAGQWEVYVASFPEGEIERQVSVGGGAAPRWDAGGRKLYYRRPGSGAIMEVPLSTPELRPGKPVQIVDGERLERDNRWERNYDVTPDGERFLMILNQEDRDAGITQFNVVLNWFDELQQLVP